jgi:Uncharacterized protein conserved in bacteria
MGMKQKNKKEKKKKIVRPDGVPVRLSIRSQIRDLAPDGDDSPMTPVRLGEGISDPEADVEVIEYKTDGMLSDDGENVTISYDESEELGFEQSSTTLSFSRGLPGTVTMIRSGGGATACRFSETERRQHCVYNTGIMPIELIINTHSVQNTFTGSSGRISLDYSIELRGMTTERNKLQVDVRPTGSAGENK